MFPKLVNLLEICFPSEEQILLPYSALVGTRFRNNDSSGVAVMCPGLKTNGTGREEGQLPPPFFLLGEAGGKSALQI